MKTYFWKYILFLLFLWKYVCKLQLKSTKKTPQIHILKKWFLTTLQINTITLKKLSTIVSVRKNITRPFVMQELVSRVPFNNSKVQLSNANNYSNSTTATHCDSVDIILRHSCLPSFAWRKILLHFFYQNNCLKFLAFYGVNLQSVQLLQVKSFYIYICIIRTWMAAVYEAGRSWILFFVQYVVCPLNAFMQNPLLD